MALLRSNHAYSNLSSYTISKDENMRLLLLMDIVTSELTTYNIVN